MLPEFAGHVLVGRVFDRKLERDGEHVQAVHRHPTRAVGLCETAAGWQGLGTVENAYVVEAEKPAFEDIVSFGVLSVYPPRKIEQKLLKYSCEKLPVGNTGPLFLD